MITNQVLTEAIQFLSHFNAEIVLSLVTMSILLSLTLLLNIRKARKSAKQLTRLQHDLKVSNASMINIGQQLLSLEKKFNTRSISEPVNSNSSLQTTKMNPDTSKLSRQFQASEPQSVNVQSRNFEEKYSPADTQVDSTVDKGDSVYDKARYYLAKGDSVENTAKRCNLSHAEVSLLKALSKKPAATF